ncbi:MAG TPA: PAS domain S-box protein [bacterium]
MNWNTEVQLPSILSDISVAIQKTVDIDIAALAVNKPGSTDLSLSISILNGENRDFPVQTLPDSTCLGFKIINGHIFLQSQKSNFEDVQPIDHLFQNDSFIRIRSSTSFPIEHEILGKGFLLLGSYRKELILFKNLLKDLDLNAVIGDSLLKSAIEIDQKKYIINTNLYYQKIFQKSIVPTILFNQDGTIIAINEAMEKLYGHKITPHTNQQNLEDLFPVPLQKNIIKYYRRYSSHQVHTMEIPFLCSNGKERIVELRMCAIDDDNQLMTASLIDITENKILTMHTKTEKDRLVMIHDLISSINSTLNKSQFTQVLFSQFKIFFDYSFIAIVLCDLDDMELDIHFSRQTPDIIVHKGLLHQLQSFNEILSTCNQIEQNIEIISKIVTILNLPVEENYPTKLLIQFKTDREIIGAMLLFRQEQINLTDYEIRIFRDLSNYFADTLGRLNLIQKYQQSLTNFSLLTQINKALNSSLDLEIMAKRIVESLQHVMQAKLCKICLLENEKLIDDPDLLHELDPKIKNILQTGQVGIFQDNDDRENHFYLPEMNFQQIGCRCILVMPITHSGKLFAIIFIFLDRSELVKEYEIDLLSMLAHHIAIAINNAKLLLRKGTGSLSTVV